MNDEHEHVEEPRSVLDTARLVLAGVVALLLVAFAIDNRHDTRVGYLFGETEAPMIVVLVVAAVAGALVGALLRSGQRRRQD
jgi:uncharacterized integral membrane protein